MLNELGQDNDGPGEKIQYKDGGDFAISSSSDLTYALVFQSSGPNDYVFMIKADGSIELGPKATLDQASKAFWDYILEVSPFVGATKKQEVRDWIQRKHATDSRDLHAVELLNELEQVLGA